ncbi:fimbria/pilus outer membrane usher protein [Cupriavidus agavae]|uniref:Outer membrane usher protein FimD/PapC n=1 Tax=Cupriavidus agavae TaxID=1001822 RepID=A0A4Q7RRR1_9BURK|nr:fimbria/pilus outer membrane usher protein [Cupriavidus agavae]RZT36314.1 outer membrane usher protein FimD/PapC [Cupriavidus agavae]
MLRQVCRSRAASGPRPGPSRGRQCCGSPAPSENLPFRRSRLTTLVLASLLAGSGALAWDRSHAATAPEGDAEDAGARRLTAPAPPPSQSDAPASTVAPESVEPGATASGGNAPDTPPDPPPATSGTNPPAAPPAAAPGAGVTDFDLDMLKSRGIDPRVADYFMEGARFSPGVTLVSLNVNGKSKGSAMVRFDEKGKLCFDARFLERAGLRMPGRSVEARAEGTDEAEAADALKTDVSALHATPPPVDGCLDFRAAWPATVVTLKPNSATVDLLVPTDALQMESGAQSDFHTGGTAALLNYDLLATRSHTDGSTTRYFSAANEFGFNAGDWIIRNRNMYSNDGNTSDFSHLYAYAQRTFARQEAVFQAGEINVGNSIFPGPSIVGAQWFPEMALRRDTGPGTSIDGIAQTQARIEVRQAGTVIYTTMVPPGPFTLTNVPLLNGSNDVEVTVIEATGDSRRFTVPAAQLNSGSLGVTPGYALAVGKLRELGGDALVKPWMATATGTWRAARNIGLTGGLMVGTQYQGAGFGVDARVFANTTNLSLRTLLSNATRENLRGGQLTASASSTLGPMFSINGTVTQETPGYRSLTDTTLDTTADWISSHYRGQYTAGVSFNHPALGGMTVNYNRSVLFSHETTQRITASWGKTFKYATVSLSLEKGIGGGSSDTGNSVYFSVSIPLGKRSVRAYVNRISGETRPGVTYNDAVSDIFNYSLNAEGRPSDNSAAGSANASITPYYTRLNLGVSQYGSDSTSYNASLTGGLVAHRHGVTFSPYPVGDTFGIASLGDVSGIKIATPQGPVWTDPWGQAVISNAPAYVTSSVEIATRTLPRNIDVTNAFRQIRPGRGSVSFVDFDVIKVRRLLLHTVDDTGQPLPRNATVVDAEGTFLTTVLNDGSIFLSNTAAAGGMQVIRADGTACALDFKMPMTQDLNAYFDEVNAVCKPVDKPVAEQPLK